MFTGILFVGNAKSDVKLYLTINRRLYEDHLCGKLPGQQVFKIMPYTAYCLRI